MDTRTISFAGRCVVIEFDIPEGREIVEFLFPDIPDTANTRPDVRLTLTRDPRDRANLALFLGDKRLWHGASKEALATILVGETIHHLTDKNAGGMALHAAALSREGRGVILPGKSGAGKSSLATWLMLHGYNYLSDELTFIPQDSMRIQAFTRPINIKTRGVAALREALDVSMERAWTSRQCVMIPHRQLRPDNLLETATLSLVLFPEYRTGSELQLEPLSKAQAGLLLMECLVNARNLNGHGFTQAARVVRAVPAFQLHYGHFDQLRDAGLRRALRLD